MELDSIFAIKELVFSDDGIKTVVLFLALDMRRQFKQMKMSIDDLTKHFKAIETSHDARLSAIEQKVKFLKPNEAL